MMAEILARRPARPQRARARTSSRAWRRRSSRPRRRARPLRGRRGSASRVVRRVAPRAVCLGNLFRDQLDRYGELELIAERWRAPLEGLPGATRVVVTPTTPPWRPVAEARPGVVRFGLDDPSAGPRATPARRRLEVLPPLRPAASTTRPPTSAISATTAARVRAAGRRSTLPPGASCSTGSTASPSISSRPGERDGSRSAVPGLYNVYNAIAAAALALELGRHARRGRGGPGPLPARVRALRADRAPDDRTALSC